MKKKAGYLLKPSKSKAQVKGTKAKKSVKRPKKAVPGRFMAVSAAEIQQLKTDLDSRASALTKLSGEYEAAKANYVALGEKYDSEALAFDDARQEILRLKDRVTELETFIRAAINGATFDFTAASVLLAK